MITQVKEQPDPVGLIYDDEEDDEELAKIDAEL